jgi:hypothetical protein
MVLQNWSAQSGASSVGPYENIGRRDRPLISCCWPRHDASALALGITNRPLGIEGPGNGPRRCLNCPGNAVVSRNRLPPGLAPLHLAAAHPRWPLRGTKKRKNSQSLGVPALHRAAECDTTGKIGRQPFVHTRNERSVQGSVEGSVASRSQSESFRARPVKERLTLRFYCVNKAARRHGNQWRAAQINAFCWHAHFCAPQHCRAPIRPA